MTHREGIRIKHFDLIPVGVTGDKPMPRNGQAYLTKIASDGRDARHYGEKITDVTTHPAFKNTIASYAELYDFQCRAENLELMTFESPDSGERVNRAWYCPRSYQELTARREAMVAWNELHYGFMGRSPDHVASTLTGLYMGLDTFERYNKERARALSNYYRYARDNDLFVTYTIINPQADKTKQAHEQADEFLAMRVLERDAEGIVVKGAKMLGTSCLMADEVFVSCIQPLGKGDEPYAVSCTVPMNAPGLTIMSRKSYEGSAHSVFDNPLSSRYDENDALLYFNEVRIPWDRVFVIDDPGMCQSQFHDTPCYRLEEYQAVVRLMVKLRFLVAVARRIAEVNGTIGIPPVREALGELASEAATVEAFVKAIEVNGCMDHNGYFVPDLSMITAAQVVTQRMYPKLMTAIRNLAGGGMIMLPSGIEDFADPDLKSYIHATQKSPLVDPFDRVKFFKLAWDAIGSEFASRHTQYEMFYAGAMFILKNHAYHSYDWGRASAMLDRLLESYDLDDELTAGQQARTP